MFSNPLFMLCSGSSAATFPTDNLIVHCKFNNNYDNDLINPATFLEGGSAPTYQENGLLSDSYTDARIKYNQSFSGLNEWSFGMWIKVLGNTNVYASVTGNVYISVNKNHSTGIPLFTSDKISMTHYNGSSYPLVASTDTINLNEWIHVMVTVNITNNTKKLYVNGVFQGTGDVNNLTVASNGTVNQGQNTSFPTNIIYNDYVFYDKELSLSEVNVVKDTTNKD